MHCAPGAGLQVDDFCLLHNSPQEDLVFVPYESALVAYPLPVYSVIQKIVLDGLLCVKGTVPRAGDLAEQN